MLQYILTILKKKTCIVITNITEILYDLFSLLFAAKIATEMNILFQFHFFHFEKNKHMLFYVILETS